MKEEGKKGSKRREVKFVCICHMVKKLIYHQLI